MKTLGMAAATSFVLGALMAPVMAEDTFDATSDRPYSIPNADAPELAALGKYKVGVQELIFNDPARPNIVEAKAGRAPVVPRDVPVTVWYPASPSDDTASAVYVGKLPFRPGVKPDNAPQFYKFRGIAAAGAPPVTAGPFPLVVLSHGYGNWATFLSYLGENLASKGYVVASIEHNDLPFADVDTFALSFGDTMLNRARDQRFIIESLSVMAANAEGLGAIIDSGTVGLIGYSMGGFGALTTAGAGYSHESPSLNQIPAAMLAGVLDDERFVTAPTNLKAVVAVSPWGAAPANRVWIRETMGNVQSPLLVLAGDQDDISGFNEGIKWIYDNAVNADRHMLVYENGRHSIGGNPEPPIANDYFDLTDWFNEPVWRRDRVVGINQHFITAFLNQHLKGDTEAASYMDVHPINSNDGEWPLPAGGYVGNAYSDGEQDGKPYWKGFQRRFAVGLKMLRDKSRKTLRQ